MGKTDAPQPGETQGPSANGSRLTFTGRIARWSAGHRWWVVAGSVLVIILTLFVLSTVETKERFDDEGVRDSGRAEERLDERFRRELVPTEERLINARGERLIFSNPSLDVDDPAFRSTVDRLGARPRNTVGEWLGV